jgi:glutathione S-transferase
MATTLYRCITPTDWLCPCGKVARALRRSGLEYDQVRVALRQRDRDEIGRLTGQRHVPVLELDEQLIVDSKRIVEHLEWRAARSANRPGKSGSASAGARPSA